MVDKDPLEDVDGPDFDPVQDGTGEPDGPDPEVLHEDDPEASVTLGDGTVVANMTAAEYNAHYDDPGLTLHSIEESEDLSDGEDDDEH